MHSRTRICLNTVRSHGRNQLLIGVLSLAAAVVLYLLSGGVAGIASATSRGDTKSRMWCFLGAIFMLFLGIFLLFQGVKHLLAPGSTSLVKSIRSQLLPEQQAQSPDELFALVDEDLNDGYQTLLGGDLLVGQEWLLFKNGPILALRLDHLQEASLIRDKKKYILTVTAQGGSSARVTVASFDSCQETLDLLQARAPQLTQRVAIQ